MHKLNTIYLCTFTFTRTGELKTSCQKQVSGWRAREEEMEEEGLVEPKETSSFVHKWISAKYLPNQKT